MEAGVLKIVQVPLDHEGDQAQYASQMFNASQIIEEQITTYANNVLVYCRTGITRSPTLVLTYASLFKRVWSWIDPHKAN
jgi:protein-tyrosine phosphatase